MYVCTSTYIYLNSQQFLPKLTLSKKIVQAVVHRYTEERRR